jgi:transcriptional regulator with XRE-family HTH domain
MHDGSGELSDWGAYLRRMTTRPGWSVARLAREAGIHRATIFDWMKGGGDKVTIASVRAVADALGDDLESALRAVAGLSSSRAQRDEEMDMIMSAPVDDDMKRQMIARALELREQQRQQRIQILQWLMASEQGPPAAGPDEDGHAPEGAVG